MTSEELKQSIVDDVAAIDEGLRGRVYDSTYLEPFSRIYRCNVIFLM